MHAPLLTRPPAHILPFLLTHCAHSPPNMPPPPQVTLLDFAPAHASSYNALVEVIRRNLLLADWCDDAHVEVGGVCHAWSLDVGL